MKDITGILTRLQLLRYKVIASSSRKFTLKLTERYDTLPEDNKPVKSNNQLSTLELIKRIASHGKKLKKNVSQ